MQVLEGNELKIAGDLAFLSTLIYSIQGSDINAQGKTIQEIVSSKEFELYSKELEKEKVNQVIVLQDYLKSHSDLKDAVVIDYSMNDLNFNKGTNAMLVKHNNAYSIVFRGTGDGEWLDNSVAYSGTYSKQQEEALRYVDYCVEKYNIHRNDTLFISGHSKGGNKAQFSFMCSKYHDYFDACYSFDGQGFSEKAITYIKSHYEADDYNNQINRLYSICGENDYIHSLGECQIVRNDRIYYVRTDQAVSFPNFHEAHYLITEGRLGNFTSKEKLTELSETLNEDVKSMSSVQKTFTVEAIMGILERFMGKEYKIGIHDEKASMLEYASFVMLALPTLVTTAVHSEFVQDKLKERGLWVGFLINRIISKDSFLQDVNPLNIPFITARDSFLKQDEHILNSKTYLSYNWSEYELCISTDELSSILTKINRIESDFQSIIFSAPNQEILYIHQEFSSVNNFMNLIMEKTELLSLRINLLLQEAQSDFERHKIRL